VAENHGAPLTRIENARPQFDVTKVTREARWANTVVGSKIVELIALATIQAWIRIAAIDDLILAIFTREIRETGAFIAELSPRLCT
tara:strand:- start:238 stop:495 length:258 start_codon:yes stop_codon:yes gene_type:complete